MKCDAPSFTSVWAALARYSKLHGAVLAYLLLVAPAAAQQSGQTGSRQRPSTFQDESAQQEPQTRYRPQQQQFQRDRDAFSEEQGQQRSSAQQQARRRRPDQAARLGLIVFRDDSDQLRVGRVLQDSPAADSALRTGDKILAVDGMQVSSLRDLNQTLGEAQQDNVEVVIERNGRTRRVQLDLNQPLSPEEVADRIAERVEETAERFGEAARQIGQRIGRLSEGALAENEPRGQRTSYENNQNLRFDRETEPPRLGRIRQRREAIRDARNGRFATDTHEGPSGFIDEEVLLGVAVVDTEQPGVRVSHVEARSPADEVNLRRGDQIVRIDGRPIRSSREFANYLTRQGGGETVELQVDRNGRRATIPVTLDYPAVARQTMRLQSAPERPARRDSERQRGELRERLRERLSELLSSGSERGSAWQETRAREEQGGQSGQGTQAGQQSSTPQVETQESQEYTPF